MIRSEAASDDLRAVGGRRVANSGKAHVDRLNQPWPTGKESAPHEADGLCMDDRRRAEL
jgi:hypothetical protein